MDTVLSALTSDVGSIALGLIGLLVLLVSRMTADDDLATQTQTTRADLLAVVATGSVLLNGISKLDVESVTAEKVELAGAQLTRLEEGSDKFPDIVWAMNGLLQATPAKTVTLLERVNDEWTLVATEGIVPTRFVFPDRTPILDRFQSTRKEEVYLPTVQNLPGKVEFSYLPTNTQAVLLLPVREGNVALVLGSNQARSFTPRDIAWCQAIASRL